ncbi:hypothetical protein D7V86_23970 [bacterium D16-51]|nr:hypothetical protein D7V96_24160 [bacterium D16-59]RKI54199.1 hypothetical protein D7V86_23970 [bacterium D16-51]
MNVFIGILGILVVVTEILLSCVKSANNHLLGRQLDSGQIAKEEGNQRHKGFFGNIVGAVFGIALFVFAFSFVIIPTGYTGVRTTFGQVDQTTLQNGFNLKIPFVQSIEKVNNKQQDIVFDKNKISSETSERNAVTFKGITITYQINPDKSAWIYANVADYKDNLVSESLVASAIKTSSKTLTPTDVTNRSILEPRAQENIQKSLDEKYGEGVIKINKVVINGAEFDKAYDEKIAKKQQAQMDYEKQQIENKKEIEKAEADAKVKKTQAQAEADATKIAADAESEANKKVADSITDKLIENKLAEAREKHGWVTVKGADTVVTKEN